MKPHNEIRYINRLARLKDFLAMGSRSPKDLVAKECLLVAAAFYDIPDIVDRVNSMVQQPDEVLLQKRKEIEEHWKKTNF